MTFQTAKDQVTTQRKGPTDYVGNSISQKQQQEKEAGQWNA